VQGLPFAIQIGLRVILEDGASLEEAVEFGVRGEAKEAAQPGMAQPADNKGAWRNHTKLHTDGRLRSGSIRAKNQLTSSALNLNNLFCIPPPW
jgi:hypothetical protein